MNEKLRMARIKRCLSESDVYQAIGADKRTYQRWEHGESVPQPYYRKKLCDFFCMSLEDLGFDLLTLLFSHVSEATALRPLQTALPSQSDTVSMPADLLDVAVVALRLAQQQYGWTREELQERTMNKLQNEQGDISRRDFSLLLAGLPLVALSTSTISPEDALPHSEASLITAWKLARGSDLTLAQSIVNAYIPALEPLAEQHTDYQEHAARLVAKSYILNGLIDMHLNNLALREKHCLQAVKYAQISEDVDLITASRRWLACTYFYMQDPVQALKEYKKAATHLDNVTPLLKSSVLVETSVIQAQQGQREEAISSLEQAHETFFVDSSEDQNNLYTGHDIGVLTLWSGLTYYQLGNYQKSLDVLLEIDGLHPKKPLSERIRLQFLNQQALASLKLNDLEQAIAYVEAAATGSLDLGSKLRYAESGKVYQIMEFLWQHESKVQKLKPLFLQTI